MLEIKHISKRYQYQKVLKDISITFPCTGLISIVGPSGCGKSTLLHIIGGIDKEFQGELLWDGVSVKRRLTRYRQNCVSFIFQQLYLIMWLSVRQNQWLPRFFKKVRKQQRSLNIQDFEYNKISALSLGQRQRIAFLRGIMPFSYILLCDEPTGSLDQVHAQEVMELLKEESKKRLVIMISHNQHLVEQYSDEIYEMKDGRIIDHTICQQNISECISENIKRKFLFSHIKLSLLSLLSHKGRSIQMIFGLTLSFVCIILTLTMSRGLEEQIQKYIYSLIPASGISYQFKNQESLDLKTASMFEQLSMIEKSEIYLDDYEFLGIGFVKERYQESQVLFIGDDTSPYEHLQLYAGKKPTQKHEIMVSLSTAKHLCQDEDLETLIGKKVYAWYQYQNKVKAIEYHVVGITNQSTGLDTLYQQSHAYIELLKEVYNIQHFSSHLGILYVDSSIAREDIVKQLNHDYPKFKFLEIGASTTQNLHESMKQIRLVLLAFSGLAILSSLFLIGEVMFLNVIQKKQDLAIMQCFGASRFTLIKIVFYEAFFIVFLAQCFCTLIYWQLLQIINMFVNEMILGEKLIFSFDGELLLMVFGISYGLVIITQIFPLTYVLRLNTVAALKE